MPDPFEHEPEHVFVFDTDSATADDSDDTDGE